MTGNWNKKIPVVWGQSSQWGEQLCMYYLYPESSEELGVLFPLSLFPRRAIDREPIFYSSWWAPNCVFWFSVARTAFWNLSQIQAPQPLSRNVLGETLFLPCVDLKSTLLTDAMFSLPRCYCLPRWEWSCQNHFRVWFRVLNSFGGNFYWIDHFIICLNAAVYPFCFHSYLGSPIPLCIFIPGSQSFIQKNDFSLRLIPIPFAFIVYEDNDKC